MKNNNQKFNIIIISFSLVIVILITSFSYGYWKSQQSNSGKIIDITGAKLNINFSNVQTLNTTNPKPINEADYFLLTDYIDFNVNGHDNSLEGCYSLYFDVQTISESLKSEYFKWILYDRDNSKIVVQGNFEDATANEKLYIVGNDLYASTSVNYRLYIFISNDTTVNEANLLGTSFSANIGGISFTKDSSSCPRSNRLYDYIASAGTPDSSIDFSYNSEGNNRAGLNSNRNLTTGLYYTADASAYGEDGKRIYYYRGNITNNWVSFGGYYWRIVRTTSEGGVKLIYSGGNGRTGGLSDSSAFIATSVFNGVNMTANLKYHVGYTYNANSYVGTQSDSIIKCVVDAWYTGSNVTCGETSYNFTSLTTKLSDYSNYLSTTAIFCNDKSEELNDDGTAWTSGNINYPAFIRLYNNNRPTFACLSTNGSRYTVSTLTGNGYLTNPVALITADEIEYSGLTYNTTSFTASYITNNATSSGWWTMSPDSLLTDSTDSYATNISLIENGYFENYYDGLEHPIRPVISLKSCVTVTGGIGTLISPFTLSNDNC